MFASKKSVLMIMLIFVLTACSPATQELVHTATIYNPTSTAVPVVPSTSTATTPPQPSPTATTPSGSTATIQPSPSLDATATPGTTIQPLTMEVCDGEAQAMEHALNVMTVTQSEAPIYDFITGTSGMGCMSTVTGTGAQFQAPDVVVNTLGSMLKDEGWTLDPMLAAGGPTGYGAGFRKGNQVALADAIWLPDASANCPKDQPISACQVNPEQQNYTITLTFGVENP